MRKLTPYIPALIMLIFTALMVGIFIGRSSLSSAPQKSTVHSVSENNSPIVGGKININTASADTLTMLPGIGPALAQRIVTYREENGDFSKLSDLANVKGVGESTLEKLKAYITIGG